MINFSGKTAIFVKEPSNSTRKMSKDNDPKDRSGSSIPSEDAGGSKSTRINLNENFEKASNKAERDIQRGFDFETKPSRPEKPKTEPKEKE